MVNDNITTIKQKVERYKKELKETGSVALFEHAISQEYVNLGNAYLAIKNNKGAQRAFEDAKNTTYSMQKASMTMIKNSWLKCLIV